MPSQSHSPSAIPSPPHTPHSSNTNSEPQVLSHPDGPLNPQPQPRSTLPSQSQSPSGIPSPLHTPHSSYSPTQSSVSSQRPSASVSTQSFDKHEPVAKSIDDAKGSDTTRSVIQISVPVAEYVKFVNTPEPAETVAPDVE